MCRIPDRPGIEWLFEVSLTFVGNYIVLFQKGSTPATRIRDAPMALRSCLDHSSGSAVHPTRPCADQQRYTAQQVQADIDAIEAGITATHPDLPIPSILRASKSALDDVRRKVRDGMDRDAVWRELSTLNPLFTDGHLHPYAGLAGRRSAPPRKWRQAVSVRGGRRHQRASADRLRTGRRPDHIGRNKDRIDQRHFCVLCLAAISVVQTSGAGPDRAGSAFTSTRFARTAGSVGARAPLRSDDQVKAGNP